MAQSDAMLGKGRKCYHLLHSIEKCDEKKELEEFREDFKQTLETIGSRRILFDNDLLRGTFRGYFEETPVTEELPTENVNGETLLFRALTKYKSGKKQSNKSDTRDKDDVCYQIIKLLIKNVPEMITFGIKGKPGECVGYSPFYLAIVKKRTNVIKQMIKQIKECYQTRKPGSDVPLAEGSTFGNTVMSAGTPLGVAALSMDKSIFQKVLELYDVSGIKLVTENSKHDNIIHSMIKYIKQNKYQFKPAKEMLGHILDADSWKTTSNKPEDIVKLLTRSKNDEHLTPLQLATKSHQFELFEILMTSESYYLSDPEDGLITQEVYDITELETTPMEEERKNSSEEYIQKVNHYSVLELVYLQRMPNVFRFADSTPVRTVIKEKWSRYRFFFYPWFIMHLVLMCLLTWAAVKRSSLQFQLENGTGINPVKEDPTCLGLSIMGCCIGACIILLYAVERYFVHWCCYRRFGARFKANFVANMWRTLSVLPYSNLTFEWFFVSFALLLILDFPLALFVTVYENECLVFAVMIGWYFVLFFLQVFRRLSFFTVLIQRVIKDMLNFAFIMGFLLIGFTVAMFMVMQGASTTDDDFASFGKTLLKMFTVMLGIGEIGDILSARRPVMAVIVFVLFVLLTTILLLNALIAMMSNSYTELMEQGRELGKVNKIHETLQKLSVIIFLESFIPQRLCQAVGKEQENRRILEIRTIKPSENEGETDDGNIFMHPYLQNFIRTIPSHGKKSKGKKKKKGTSTTGRNSIVRPATLDITEQRSGQGS